MGQVVINENTEEQSDEGQPAQTQNLSRARELLRKRLNKSMLLSRRNNDLESDLQSTNTMLENSYDGIIDSHWKKSI